jgi:hypothetical protein
LAIFGHAPPEEGTATAVVVLLVKHLTSLAFAGAFDKIPRAKPATKTNVAFMTISPEITVRQLGLARMSWSLEFCDLKLPAGLQAVAIPPGSFLIPAREHFGAHAARIARVRECVCARCREGWKIPRRLATSNPSLLAGFAARLATTVAIAGDTLKLVKLL